MASSDAPPEPVTINGKSYRPVREGLASILAPYQENTPGNEKLSKNRNNDQGNQAVFYNPIQQFNRDLTVLAITIYGEGALATKSALYEKKDRSRKSKRNGKKDAGGQSNGIPPETRKRKLDEVEVEPDDYQTETKKARVEDPASETPHVSAEAEAPSNGALSESDLAVNYHQDKAAQTETDQGGSDPKSRRIPFAILDALSATGLRALRYAKEIPFATNIIANDMSREAVQAIELNIDHNDVKDKVHSNVGDARAYMYSKIGNEQTQPSAKYVHRFDVVDLDPYGTAAPFIDAAVQSLLDGGLLCVTCTDAGVFASTGYLEKTYALYGGLPAKGAHSHEVGLRLIIHSVAQTAAKYGLSVEPLLSLSIDFYARLFIRIHKRPNEVKLLAGTTMITYNCDSGCGAWTTQPVARNTEKKNRNESIIYKHNIAQGPTTAPHCDHCGFKMHIGGPMWAGPLHNPYFVQRMIDRTPSMDSKTYGTIDRLRGMLTVALEEDLTLASSSSSADLSSQTKSGSTSPTITTDAPEDPADPSLNGHTDGHRGQAKQEKATDVAIIPRLPPATIDVAPFLIIPNYLAKILHAQTPSEAQIRGAIRSTGYRVTRSHCKAGSIKTDAPWTVLWEIYREWVRQKCPIKAGSVKPGSPGWKILGAVAAGTQPDAADWILARQVRDVKDEVARGLEKTESRDDIERVLRAALYRLEHGEGDRLAEQRGQLSVVFDEALGREKPRGKLVRYQINPRENWGPMNRAGGS